MNLLLCFSYRWQPLLATLAPSHIFEHCRNNKKFSYKLCNGSLTAHSCLYLSHPTPPHPSPPLPDPTPFCTTKQAGVYLFLPDGMLVYYRHFIPQYCIRFPPEVFSSMLTFPSLHKWYFNPLTPIGDQDRISPYNINTISSRQVMGIKKNIN